VRLEASVRTLSTQQPCHRGPLCNTCPIKPLTLLLLLYAVFAYHHGQDKLHAVQTYLPQPPPAEYCNRGSLLDAVDRGTLHLQAGAGGPNLPAIVACAQEVAGKAGCLLALRCKLQPCASVAACVHLSTMQG